MMEFLTVLATNWAEIGAGGIVATAAAGKLAEVLITTVGNVRDTYRKTFPKQYIINSTYTGLTDDEDE
jgi:hypothetical protein